MEKKSFLSGISAKIALSIVALSGALLTGCYKDDGLDVNGVVLPDPTYTIAGQVVDAETFAPIASAAVSGDVSASVVNGAFSVEVKEAKTYTLSVKGVSGYEDATVNVDVKEINKGQSAVYTTLIALQPKYDGLYTINTIVVDEDGNKISGATVAVRNLDGSDATNGKLEGGNSYVLVASAEGYVTSQVTVELPKVKVNTTKDVYVVLSKKAEGTVKIYGEVRIGNRTFSARKIELRAQDGTILGIDEGYTYSFEVAESYFSAATRAAGKSATFQMTIVDNNGVEVTFNKTYEIAASGSTGSNESANSDVKIGVSTATSSVDNYAIKSETKIVSLCNEEEYAKTISIAYNSLTGTKFEDQYTNTLNAANVTASTSNFYEGIISALNPQGLAVQDFEEGAETSQDYVLDALSELVSVKVNYVGLQSIIELTGFTVDGKAVEIESLNSVIGAKSATTTYAGANLSDHKIISISHGHSHSHGHGASNNAGGGIGNAE